MPSATVATVDSSLGQPPGPCSPCLPNYWFCDETLYMLHAYLANKPTVLSIRSLTHLLNSLLEAVFFCAGQARNSKIGSAIRSEVFAQDMILLGFFPVPLESLSRGLNFAWVRPFCVSISVRSTDSFAVSNSKLYLLHHSKRQMSSSIGVTYTACIIDVLKYSKYTSHTSFRWSGFQNQAVHNLWG